MTRRSATLALASALAALSVLSLTAPPAFAANQTLRVTVTGPGTVYGSGIECGRAGGPCESEVEEGNAVTLTAASTERGIFKGWAGCTNVNGPECEITLTAAIALSAEFEELPQLTLTVTTEGAGALYGSAPGGFTPIECGNGAETCQAEYNEYAEITLTASASPDNHLEKWEGGGCESRGDEPTCEVTMSAAESIKAVFAPTFHTVTLAPTGLGRVSATNPAFGIANCSTEPPGGTCEAEYQEGKTLTLTASPAAHHHVAKWIGCTEAVSDACELEIGAASTTVEPLFAINQHAIMVSPTGSGSVSAATGSIIDCTIFSGACSGEYDETSTLILTATPAAHYHFEQWTGCTHSSGNTCEVEVGTSSVAVGALYAPNTQILTVTPTGPGYVIADSGPIAACSAQGGVCSGSYDEAGALILTADPAPHQTVEWSGCARAEEDTCEVTIGATATAVHASFVPFAHALTVVKAGTGTGSVSCNGAPCASTYPEGTILTLTATPSPTSTFADWSGGGCSGTGPCNLTLNADTQVTATFNANPPPPAEEHCVVPDLAGKTQAQAAAALIIAHCTLGKVNKPKKKGHLVVKSSSPAAATSLPVGNAVNLKLSLQPKMKKH